MFIVAFGNTIAMNIASEKASRNGSNASESEASYNDVCENFSGCFNALLQLVILACGYLIPYLLGWVDLESASLFGIPIDFTKLDAKVISMFLVYFITGYLLYAMMYAAAGAVVSKTEDLQAVSFPVMILIMAAFFISIKSLSDPNSTIVVVSSYVPFLHRWLPSHVL